MRGSARSTNQPPLRAPWDIRAGATLGGDGSALREGDRRIGREGRPVCADRRGNDGTGGRAQLQPNGSDGGGRRRRHLGREPEVRENPPDHDGVLDGGACAAATPGLSRGVRAAAKIRRRTRRRADAREREPGDSLSAPEPGWCRSWCRLRVENHREPSRRAETHFPESERLHGELPFTPRPHRPPRSAPITWVRIPPGTLHLALPDAYLRVGWPTPLSAYSRNPGLSRVEALGRTASPRQVRGQVADRTPRVSTAARVPMLVESPPSRQGCSPAVNDTATYSRPTTMVKTPTMANNTTTTIVPASCSGARPTLDHDLSLILRCGLPAVTIDTSSTAPRSCCP
jgi:hypothetical protein